MCHIIGEYVWEYREKHKNDWVLNRVMFYQAHLVEEQKLPTMFSKLWDTFCFLFWICTLQKWYSTQLFWFQTLLDGVECFDPSYLLKILFFPKVVGYKVLLFGSRFPNLFYLLRKRYLSNFVGSAHFFYRTWCDCGRLYYITIETFRHVIKFTNHLHMF